MGMMFCELDKALSVKSCYSRILLSSAVFMLTLLLSAAFLIQELPGEPRDINAENKTALLE